MKCLVKTASLLAVMLASVAPMSMAQSPALPAEAEQLLVKSTNLEMKELIDLVHALALEYPESADLVLQQALASRNSWTDVELASIFATVVTSLPDTRDALGREPEEVQRAIETGEVDTTKIKDQMGVALLNVIATASSVGQEQRARAGAVIAHAVDHATDIAAINRLAKGELSNGMYDTLDEHVQAKENPRSHERVYEEFEEAQDDSTAGDTTLTK